jgi:hypothetical protein
MRADFHRDQTLAGFSEADDRIQRGMSVEAFVGGCELDYLARAIFGTGERAIEPERNGPVGNELQVGAIDFERRAFFGAARDQADGGDFVLSRLMDPEILRARQSAPDQHAAAG